MSFIPSSRILDQLRNEVRKISQHNRHYFRKKNHTVEEKKRHLEVMMKTTEIESQLSAISNHRAA